MKVRFSAADVRAWGDFSGDHNPIHFDSVAARQAGLDDVVVHGMLALLPVKQLLGDEHRAANEQERWARFKAFFRSSIPYDQPQSVTLTARDARRTEFSVRSADTQAERLRGFFMRNAPDDERPPAAMTRRPLDDARPRLAAFAKSFPAIEHLWIALDAIAFSEFVRRDMRDVASRVLGTLVPEQPANGIRGVTIMQTSQILAVSNAVLEAPLSHFLAGPSGKFAYGFETGLVVITAGEVSGTVRTALWIDGVHAIHAEYGLLVRTSVPLSERATETAGASHVGR
jgi:hypothetical protein